LTTSRKSHWRQRPREAARGNNSLMAAHSTSSQATKITLRLLWQLRLAFQSLFFHIRNFNHNRDQFSNALLELGAECAKSVRPSIHRRLLSDIGTRLAVFIIGSATVCCGGLGVLTCT
jgi:hypothetical protein